MPSTGRQQQLAMFAAASGHSTLGIPKSVGEDFVAADKEKAKKEKSSFSAAMQASGVAKGDGKHKRHPATSHYRAPSVSQAQYRSK